jgi:hypothetical protein
MALLSGIVTPYKQSATIKQQAMFQLKARQLSLLNSSRVIAIFTKRPANFRKFQFVTNTVQAKHFVAKIPLTHKVYILYVSIM